MPAGGAGETATARYEEESITAGDEGEETAAAEGEEESTARCEEESTAAREVKGESTATAAGRMPHLLYGVLPAGASREMAGGFFLPKWRWRRTTTSKPKAAKKSAPSMGNATFALRNFQGNQVLPALNRLWCQPQQGSAKRRQW